MGKALISVITSCHNQSTYTRLCVASLLRHTPPPFELVIVNDGSTDDTLGWLAEVARIAGPRLRVVTTDSPLCWPASRNRGLDVARGDYLVLLDNDTVLTEGWLGGMIAVAESDSSVGLVGPMSNYAAPPQVISTVPYRNLHAMRKFAARRRRGQAGHPARTEWLDGFCLLMKRRTFEVVGGLDERLAVFDDDDLSLQVQRAGYRLMVARDVFVHNFGARTLDGQGLDVEDLIRECRWRLASKWGDNADGRDHCDAPQWGGRLPSDPTRSWRFRIDLERFAAAPGIAPTTATTQRPALLNPGPRRLKVSLAMIVRDEEANLPSCLDSAAGLFDEVVVVDTGSADRTIAVATSCGARVGHFIWCDDFAAARNASLDLATGDYVFWLDADDRIEPAERPRIRQLLDGLDSTDSAYFFHYIYPGDRAGDEFVINHLRLFPRKADVRWTYRIHEQIIPALHKSLIKILNTDIRVRHDGYLGTPASQKRKRDRTLRLLLAEEEVRPGDPLVCFYLASVALEEGDSRGALDYLKRCLADPNSCGLGAKPYIFLAEAHRQLGEMDAALAACAAGRKAFPEDPEPLFSEAGLRMQAGDKDGAEACWLGIMASEPPRTFLMVNKGIYSHICLRNLAMLRQERGDHLRALRLWGRVLAECPGDPEATANRAWIARRPHRMRACA